MGAHHARDRRGCLTCRRRKKKCSFSGDSGGITADEENERCAACKRLNLGCVWEDERSLAVARPTDAARRQSSGSFSTPSISPSLAYGPVVMGDDPVHDIGHRRTALRYYVQSFAATLSTNEENNGFLSVLLPMAMESRPLLDALVAWSTSHLALHHDNFQIRALEDRSAAFRSFASGLRQLPSDLSVAVCLVLTSMESVLGNTNDWYRHLSAAASIIRSTATTISPSEGDEIETPLVDTSEGRWLLRNFAYHDVLASVSLNRGMLIPSSIEWLLLEQAGHETVLDTYLGVGCAPVTALGKINTLSRQLDMYSQDPSLVPDDRDGAVIGVVSDLEGLEEELLGWQVSDSVQDEALRALAETYRSASLICLYRSLRFNGLRNLENINKSIGEQVTNVVRSMNQLPSGCLPECTLLFPLFIAGAETSDIEHQLAIAARMNAVVQNRSFTNVEVALDVLREVWDVQSRTLPVNPARPYDWTCVLDRRKWQLALS